jgi:hypothetical protein
MSTPVFPENHIRGLNPNASLNEVVPFALQQILADDVADGSKADITRSLGMSALPPKADIERRHRGVRP